MVSSLGLCWWVSSLWEFGLNVKRRSCRGKPHHLKHLWATKQQAAGFNPNVLLQWILYFPIYRAIIYIIYITHITCTVYDILDVMCIWKTMCIYIYVHTYICTYIYIHKYISYNQHLNRVDFYRALSESWSGWSSNGRVPWKEESEKTFWGPKILYDEPMRPLAFC